MQPGLLDSLFDREESRPLTVTELNAQVCAELERRFASVWVEGEISGFSSPASGHWYFTLRDGNSQVRAACYRGSNYRISFRPFDGLQVKVRGKLSLYEPKGEYQILVESLSPTGEGSRRVALQQIKARLEADGLFAPELRRPLPFFPRRIGLVTSPNGAALFDMLNVIGRRAGSICVVLIPARVQGETAGDEISEAIRRANEFNLSAAAHERIDVLIVGRGGGSAEDLWAFNEENVARAIRASDIPVISAVGHEVDHTVADLVADLRAATPSAAAELVAQREEDLVDFFRTRTNSLERSMNYRLLACGRELEAIEACSKNAIRDRMAEASRDFDAVRERLSPGRLSAHFAAKRGRLDRITSRLAGAGPIAARVSSESLGVLMAKLNALSPLNVLQRGYSITTNATGSIVQRAASVGVGDRLKIQLADGTLDAEVLEAGKPE